MKLDNVYVTACVIIDIFGYDGGTLFKLKFPHIGGDAQVAQVKFRGRVKV